MEDKSCEDCMFFEEYSEYHIWGYCRRYPPNSKREASETYKFGTICGEFKQVKK